MNQRSINHLTNVDKAAILHELLPHAVNPLLDMMVEVANLIEKDFEKIKAEWAVPLISADGWLQFANEVRLAIQLERKQLVSNKRKFANELFGGLLATFSNHCMMQLIAQDDAPKLLAEFFNLYYNSME
jgi:hypothetical protein